jgi:hypothetical protein
LPNYSFLNIVPREPLHEDSNLFDGCAHATTAAKASSTNVNREFVLGEFALRLASHDSTRRDLAMVDISREGNEQLAGECYVRDAADPAALGANALAKPTAESTGGLVISPTSRQARSLWTQTRIACLRDALFVVDAATLPWTGSQAS